MLIGRQPKSRPPATGGAVTISAEVRRGDGLSGSVLVNQGVIAFKPGQVTAANLAKVRVYVDFGAGWVEQSIYIARLWDSLYPDGSYPSAHIQFNCNIPDANPLPAKVVVDIVARATSDIALTPVTFTNVCTSAALLMTDRVHLCACHLTLEPLQPATADDATTTAHDTTLWYQHFNEWKHGVNGAIANRTLSAQANAGASSLSVNAAGSAYWGSGDKGRKIVVGTYPSNYEFAQVSKTVDPVSGTIALQGTLSKTWAPNTPVSKFATTGADYGTGADLYSGLLDSALYEPYRMFIAQYIRLLDADLYFYAREYWRDVTSGYDTPDGPHRPLVNTENMPSNNYEGLPGEPHMLSSISHRVMYLCTGWGQTWRNMNYQCQWVSAGLTSQAAATALGGYISDAYGMRFNAGHIGRPIIGRPMECTQRQDSSGGFGAGHVIDYPTELGWILDALETWKYTTSDLRNGVVGINPTNRDSAFRVNCSYTAVGANYVDVSTAGAENLNVAVAGDVVGVGYLDAEREFKPVQSNVPPRLTFTSNLANSHPVYGDYRDAVFDKTGWTNFQVPTIGEPIRIHYAYNKPDSRIPGWIQALVDAITAQANINTGNLGYPYPTSPDIYEHPYQSYGGTIANGLGNPSSFPMHRTLAAWVYLYTGTPGYQTWRDRMTNTANNNVNQVTPRPKISGEVWFCLSIGAYRSGAAKIREDWAATSIVQPPAH